MAHNKPTILFVPGAWHGPEIFDPLTSILQSLGYKTLSVSLPSVGASPPVEGFEPDVAAVRNALAPSVEAGSEVVVFAHSYGGVPASEAIKGLTKADLESQGKPGGVVHFILCASFLIPEGMPSANPETGPTPQFELNEEKTIVASIDPIATFYNDLPRETAERLAAGLKKHSYRVFWSKATYAAWRHVPTTYLYAENDQAVPLQVQKMMVERSGVDMRTETFNTGHTIFVSLPDKVAESIRRAAGESV